MSRLSFDCCGRSVSGITFRYNVFNGGVLLGGISWYAPWRRYTFSPAQGTTFDPECLRDIADYCEAQTTEHKQS